jgi:CheY-like chemotaxis protein
MRAARVGTDIHVAVRDDGRGISPELLPQVFELFTQRKRPFDRAEGGLGLGLAIVKSLVESHGGAVDVESVEGRGSTFTVRLPALHTAPATALEAWPENRLPARQRRVLIVDDNADLADILASALEALGFETRVANDGPSALTIARDFKPGMGLLDIGLPVMDGYELAKNLRQLPELSMIRLIAITGYGEDADRRRSSDAGFEAHLVKPVELAKLVGVMHHDVDLSGDSSGPIRRADERSYAVEPTDAKSSI